MSSLLASRLSRLAFLSVWSSHPVALSVTCRSSRKYLSTASVEEWCSTERRIELRDKLLPDRLADLYISLPTLISSDGVAGSASSTSELSTAANSPEACTPLPYGHHITFCHPRYPADQLNPVNGTEKDFEPPPPFARRMWVGGKWLWPIDSHKGAGLLVGKDVRMRSYVGRESVSLKGFDGTNPMIFVNQRMEFTHPNAEPQKPAGVVEERRHVYMLPQKEPSSGGGGRAPRPVKEIPTRSDFSFHYTPTPIHLFRFSALIFNAHYIHLDRVYAKQAGYPDLLVHGPLTALMLLEAFKTRNRGVQLKSFEYRAHNPMLVDQRVTVHGVMNSTSGTMGSVATESGTKMARLWCETDDGIVGMSAWVEYY